MERLYDTEPYCVDFEAVVQSCVENKDKFEVTLDRTAFYPEGGGQPYDTGVLGGASVTAVYERDGRIFHYTDQSLAVGSRVRGRIDWDRRFLNMQQHSGEHIVSGLIHEKYGFDNVGFHMGSSGMTIDLNGILEWGQLLEIERQANQVVYENRELVVTYPSEAELEAMEYRSKKALTGQVRIVKIPGADVCACCGTHVKRTGEIGLIKFSGVIHYKGGVRISMICGKKALEDYEKKTDQINYLTNLLSAKSESVQQAVKALKAESQEKDLRIGSLYRQIFELKAEAIEDAGDSLLLFEEGLAPVQIRQFCNLLMEKKKARITAVCAAKEDCGHHYCIASPEKDMRKLGKALNTRLNGRGGGSAQMVQGSFASGEDEIRRAFEDEVKIQ